jgi:hypothetical protein
MRRSSLRKTGRSSSIKKVVTFAPATLKAPPAAAAKGPPPAPAVPFKPAVPIKLKVVAPALSPDELKARADKRNKDHALAGICGRQLSARAEHLRRKGLAEPVGKVVAAEKPAAEARKRPIVHVYHPYAPPAPDYRRHIPVYAPVRVAPHPTYDSVSAAQTRVVQILSSLAAGSRSSDDAEYAAVSRGASRQLAARARESASAARPYLRCSAAGRRMYTFAGDRPRARRERMGREVRTGARDMPLAQCGRAGASSAGSVELSRIPA